jgi:dTMP kinase
VSADRPDRSRGARGAFFVLDGIDGCGKSTQALLLAQALERAGRRPLHLREPGSTQAGERIRAILLARDMALSPAVEALLVCAARAHMLATRVAPALADGRDVVCERFHAATFAYQGVAGGLGEERVLALLRGWAADPAPDRTVLLELDVERASARRGTSSDRIEDLGPVFQRRVAEGYRRYLAHDPSAVAVDGSGSREQVFARVVQALGLEVMLGAP